MKKRKKKKLERKYVLFNFCVKTTSLASKYELKVSKLNVIYLSWS